MMTFQVLALTCASSFFTQMYHRSERERLERSWRAGSPEKRKAENESVAA